jgi:cytochrome P450
MTGTPAWAAAITVQQLDADPYPLYARMRREAPVCFVPAVDLWLVTRWDDVEFSTSHPELFDSAVSPSPLDRTMGGPSILVLDGEPQKKLRAMLDPSLRPRVVEATTPELIEPLVAELLDGLESRGRAELMSEYFEPISVLGLGRVLGIPQLGGDTLRRWFYGLAQGAINFENDPEKWAVSDATGAEIDRELAPTFARLFAEPDGTTISTMLQQATGSLDERVAQILPTLKVILLGGMQEPGHGAGTTVVGLLLSGQAVMVAADPAGLTSTAVEEGLRWVAPIGTQTRRACGEIELGGVTLPVGSSLGVLVSSANRDETVWGPTAAEFDLTRPRRTHAAFGFGPHFCSGHHFSRVQVRIAVQRLFERLPGLRLDPERPPIFTGWEFRAPRNLNVLWDT